MGFAGIDLNAGTVLVAAISLGLVDDYTVHCISRLRSEMERGGTLGNIVADSLRHVGPAMLYTSILTVGGFALLGLADFRPFAHQGLLTAMAIGVAFVVDVLILPAMLSCLPGTLGTAGAASAVVAKHEPHVGEAVGHGMI
jgi:predicted RND superfamily exporter protein